MNEFDENDLVNKDYENTTTQGDNPNYTAIRDRERVNKKNVIRLFISAMLL